MKVKVIISRSSLTLKRYWHEFVEKVWGYHVGTVLPKEGGGRGERDLSVCQHSLGGCSMCGSDKGEDYVFAILLCCIWTFYVIDGDVYAHGDFGFTML